jgi:chromosome segregation ATPase
MIEPIMYFGVGFLFASMLGLVFIPLVHARAVRLTMRRIEAATPLTKTEIQADKDQLRAEFAMSTRRLEMSVEQMKAKTTSQLAELAKKSSAVTKLKNELGEKTAAIQTLEARERATRDKLRATEEEFTQRLNALREAEQKLADKEGELAKLSATLDQRAVEAESQRIETVALNTQIEALRSRAAEFEHDLKDTDNRLAHQRTAAEATAQELGSEQAKVANLDSRIVELEKHLAARTADAEALGERAQDLEKRLAQREHQYEQVGAQLTNAQKIEADLRGELAALIGRHDTTAQAERHETSLLTEQLERANQERIALQRDLAKIRRETDSSLAAERGENEVLRERINDIAAEIARLTAALEGSNSPIDQMLTQQTTQTLAVAGAQVAHGESEAAPSLIPTPRNGGSLADRIRALQNRAARQTAN